MFIFFFTILYFEIIWQLWSIVKECQSFFVVIFYMNETRPNSFHDVQCTRFNNMRKKFNKQHTCFLPRTSVSLSVRYTDNKGRCWRIAGFLFSRFVLFVFNFLFVWFFLSARGFFFGWLLLFIWIFFYTICFF